MAKMDEIFSAGAAPGPDQALASFLPIVFTLATFSASIRLLS